MPQVLRVFLSHTSEMRELPGANDLSFVAAAERGVKRAGCALSDMEYFAASPSPPADECAKRVRECDVLVAIVGHRYGSIVPNLGISYTEFEYVIARRSGIRCFAFLLAEGVHPDAGGDPTSQSRQRQFRSQLAQDLTIKSFGQPTELELYVFEGTKDAQAAGAAGAAGPAGAAAPSPRAGCLGGLLVLAAIVLLVLIVLSVLTRHFPPDVAAIRGTRQCSGIAITGEGNTSSNPFGSNDIALGLTFTNGSQEAAGIPGLFSTSVQLAGGETLELFPEGSVERASLAPGGRVTRRYTAHGVSSTSDSAEVRVSGITQGPAPFNRCRASATIPVG